MGTSRFESRYENRTRIYSKSILLLFLSLLLFSCGGGEEESGPVVKPIYYSLTIAIAEPLGVLNGGLPEDIQSLCMPVVPKDCSAFLLAPEKVQILRVDLPDAKPEPLELKELQNAVQKGMRQPLTLKKASSVRKDDLSKKKITSYLAQPRGAANTVSENLGRVFATDANSRILSLGKAPVGFKNADVGKEKSESRSIEEYATNLAGFFCSKAGEEPKGADLMVLYKVGLATEVAASPGASGENNRELLKEKCGNDLERALRVIYADGVKTTDEQTELSALLHKCGLTSEQVVQMEMEIKDRLGRSEMSLKQGMMYASQKKYAQAVTEFQNCVDTDPRNAYGWANLCEAFLSLGSLNQALNACNKAIATDSQNWLANYSLGLYFAKTGEKDSAIKFLSEALRLVVEGKNQQAARREIIQQLKVEPAFASLRGDSRFRQLMDAQ